MSLDTTNETEEKPGKPRHLPEIPDEDWDLFNEMRKRYKRSWTDVFLSFKLYQPVIETVLALPPEITRGMATGVHTVTNLMPMWAKSIRENMPYIVENPDIKKVSGKHENTPAIVIGAGPSLFDNASGTDHLKMLHDSKFGGVIIATDRILRKCYEYGIYPDYVVVVDGSDRIYDRFFDHDIVRENAYHTTAILVNHADQSIAKDWGKYGGGMIFFTCGISQEILPNAASIIGLITDNTEMNSGGNTGSFAINAAHYIKCSPVALIGMDMSYKIGTPLNETNYYESYKEKTGFTDEEMWKDELFQTGHNPFFDVPYFTDTMFETYADPLKNYWIAEFGKNGTKVINCTEGGALHSDGIECGWFKDFLETRG
jgi:hypothetical protein